MIDIEDSCPFCDIPLERVINASVCAVAIRDGFPVSRGHTLIIPKRHVYSFFELSPGEINSCMSLLVSEQNRMAAEFGTIDFNVGINIGETAGQTVAHAHIHIIPRYKGDHPNPRGGVRAVIPGKADYR